MRAGRSPRPGALVAELPRLWLRPTGAPSADRCAGTATRASRRRSRAAAASCFLTPHIGCFEVAGAGLRRALRPRRPITVLYRPARKPWLRDLVETARAAPALATAPATLAGVRQMLRALRARRGGRPAARPGAAEGLGVWAPFFGQPAYTMTSRRAWCSRPARCCWWPGASACRGGAGYVVHVAPLAEPLPADADGERGRRGVNRAMERFIPQRPGQYLWGYNRYKTPRAAAGAALSGASQRGPRLSCWRLSGCVQLAAAGAAGGARRALGACCMRFAPARAAIALRNVELCLPEQDAGASGARLVPRALPVARAQPPRARPALVRSPERLRRLIHVEGDVEAGRAQRAPGDVAGAALHGARRRRRSVTAVPEAQGASRSTRRRATRCWTRRCAGASAPRQGRDLLAPRERASR